MEARKCEELVEKLVDNEAAFDVVRRTLGGGGASPPGTARVHSPHTPPKFQLLHVTRPPLGLGPELRQ